MLRGRGRRKDGRVWGEGEGALAMDKGGRKTRRREWT